MLLWISLSVPFNFDFNAVVYLSRLLTRQPESKPVRLSLTRQRASVLKSSICLFVCFVGVVSRREKKSENSHFTLHPLSARDAARKSKVICELRVEKREREN
jgi:hypothetical protein